MKQVWLTQNVITPTTTFVDIIQRIKWYMKCGGRHRACDEYPALGTECRMCGKCNHWASTCKAKRRDNNKKIEQKDTLKANITKSTLEKITAIQMTRVQIH